MSVAPKNEIQKYLQTGDYDADLTAWSEGGYFDRAGAELKNALILEVKRRNQSTSSPTLIPADPVTFTRNKVTPMVRGLFNRHEQEMLLGVLEHSVIFLTSTNICDVLQNIDWPYTRWVLANLYLASIGAELLGADAPQIVGLSEGPTCYVSMEYFHEDDKFADFVIHEVAHIFHNCKRYTVGLPEKRRCEWLLDIKYQKRETFAYACEAYSRILELGNSLASRKNLLGELTSGPMPTDKRVDINEYLDILREALEARNGWKCILARCAKFDDPTLLK
ncbi:MAG: hypothetical protein A2048_00855 [Deltaproteobacteria bacterium GWA2_45_12]|nr:MAG: hypothetical protein A2048_00855 [Deltaproteobacteria bacterium GWA2_45_12]